jgi:hypothetical protein
MTETIRIACEGSDTLDLESISILQGELKELSKKNYDRLRNSIVRNGFSAPLFIWTDKGGTNYLLDGTQRHRVLSKMKSEGYEIPPLPVAYIEAADIKDARQKLLFILSQYGEVTRQGLYEFVIDADFELSELDSFRLPDVEMESFKAEFFEDAVTPDNIDIGDDIKHNRGSLVCPDELEARFSEQIMRRVEVVESKNENQNEFDIRVAAWKMLIETLEGAK